MNTCFEKPAVTLNLRNKPPNRKQESTVKKTKNNKKRKHRLLPPRRTLLQTLALRFLSVVNFQNKWGETCRNEFLEISTTGEAEINCSKEAV